MYAPTACITAQNKGGRRKGGEDVDEDDSSGGSGGVKVTSGGAIGPSSWGRSLFGDDELNLAGEGCKQFNTQSSKAQNSELKIPSQLSQ